jgi:nicotinamide mononucleotide transporter
MEAFHAVVLTQWQQQSTFEVFAVIFSVAYVWFAAEESIFCWPAAFISTSLFAYVFWDVSLFFQVLLNGYYLVMAVVGFLHWRRSNENGFVALSMPLKLHVIVIGGGLLCAMLLVTIATQFGRQWFTYDLLYLDAGITVFSLLTTYLTVKKYVQSWMYWSVINFLSVYLLIANELYLTVVLMVVYIVIAMRGYINWSQNLSYQDEIS